MVGFWNKRRNTSLNKNPLGSSAPQLSKNASQADFNDYIANSTEDYVDPASIAILKSSKGIPLPNSMLGRSGSREFSSQGSHNGSSKDGASFSYQDLRSNSYNSNNNSWRSKSSSEDSHSGSRRRDSVAYTDKEVFPNGVKRELKGIMLMGEGNDDVLIRARTYINHNGELHFTLEDLEQYMLPAGFDDSQQVQLKMPMIYSMSRSGFEVEDSPEDLHWETDDANEEEGGKKSGLSSWAPKSPDLASQQQFEETFQQMQQQQQQQQQKAKRLTLVEPVAPLNGSAEALASADDSDDEDHLETTYVLQMGNDEYKDDDTDAIDLKTEDISKIDTIHLRTENLDYNDEDNSSQITDDDSFSDYMNDYQFFSANASANANVNMQRRKSSSLSQPTSASSSRKNSNSRQQTNSAGVSASSSRKNSGTKPADQVVPQPQPPVQKKLPAVVDEDDDDDEDTSSLDDDDSSMSDDDYKYMSVRAGAKVQEDVVQDDQVELEQEAIQQEKDRLERERAEREKTEKAEKAQKAEKERLEKLEIAEKARVEKLRLEQERIERDRAERQLREKAEKDRLEKERIEKARLEKERIERDRQLKEKERQEKIRIEREKLEIETRERLERERLEQERRLQEQLAAAAAASAAKSKIDSDDKALLQSIADLIDISSIPTVATTVSNHSVSNNNVPAKVNYRSSVQLTSAQLNTVANGGGVAPNNVGGNANNIDDIFDNIMSVTKERRFTISSSPLEMQRALELERKKDEQTKYSRFEEERRRKQMEEERKKKLAEEETKRRLEKVELDRQRRQHEERMKKLQLEEERIKLQAAVAIRDQERKEQEEEARRQRQLQKEIEHLDNTTKNVLLAQSLVDNPYGSIRLSDDFETNQRIFDKIRELQVEDQASDNDLSDDDVDYNYSIRKGQKVAQALAKAAAGGQDDIDSDDSDGESSEEMEYHHQPRKSKFIK
ncbi:hypothetical protein SAMD00019534_080120 [Acytostelium subglobosum LB1]|uniref:hypothetical protein n=1 Tax=Acytostelium subglobosum LB1 TaxID=1410327 RepID=UPI00064487AA|nr:hypothetical protein SAMD00019534_080120 [Acytostelium subglobosum LB1]GAM24837.1 hypothetical protein SAMD00019534_080120 [Acytostelium subglobosum LB1]|eukprot:XP_012752506.1 hypothetical protein SAMD00019534_080120 [Acytostelium subglobosum LB1]